MILNGLVLLLLAFFTPKVQVLNVTQVEKALSSAVLLHIKMYITDPSTLKTDVGMAGCSGTFISEGTILTAAHCFGEPFTNIWVKDSHGVTLDGKLVKIDPPHDLALVAVIHKKAHAYTRLAKSVKVGEQVINVGSPYGLGLMLSEGIVAKLNSMFKPFTGHYILHTGMINPGSSGGGCLNKDGELMGVNTLSIGGPFGWAGISASVDLQTIKAFLGVK